MKSKGFNRFRFTLFVVLVIIILTCSANLILGLYDAEGSEIVEYITIEIQPGDTLWDIALEYMPNTMDPREAVFELCKINNISANTLYAGIEIEIPIYH